ncbi:anoctamin-8 isoform X2 [Episyrphus balteatus]|uniref:anoctamin-8 isoform X2 n=1 Tax=Episyrphus balteatus TaxID=286459 RepID=UPI002484F48E|nr:anoctamin-8 isoform X2 [Episyrphus balteatus]
MNKSSENLIHGGAGDISSERQSSEDVHESDAGLEDFTDDTNNFESNLRRRKGKIISCAKETIENASRQLRRKVPYAGHLMTPRRLWLNKIPTQCDVVIEFPEDAPDEALRWLLARIRSQPPSGLGLVAQVKAHESTKRNAFYISAPTNILYKAAEEARLPKRLRTDLGGALKEFTTRESHCFLQIKCEDGSASLFTSQERQWLVLQVLQGLRAGQSDLDALHGRAAVEEGQSIVAAWQELGLITQVFPLHETSALTNLQSSWVKQIFAPQPLDDIAEYFGVKVALYFAWLGHYTCALGVPAVFGSILYAILWGKGQTAQDMGHVLFSLFNVAWASLYLEAWKRYSVELAFRWGTLSTPPELLEPPRPLYKGPLVESNVTGRLEPKEAPAWKRRAFRYLVSFPIIALCLLLVFVVMFLMLRFQDWWDEKLPEESVLCCLSVIPKVLLAGAITLMDEAYYKLAVWLNDKENYRLQSKYENHLIAKVALFQFVNSFLSLFYIAFYLRDEEKLKEQLAGLLISRQIIGNLRESALPYCIEQWKLARLSFTMWGALSPTQDVNRTILDDAQVHQQQSSTKSPNNESIDGGGGHGSTTTPAAVGGGAGASPSPSGGNLPAMGSLSSSATKRNIGQAEIESSLFKYDGTFSDHLEMLVQMGYVVLFSAAFPLAGICALVNNLMEIRSDAFKLAHVHQRPFGQRVANIGTWQNALSVLSLAAVIVNCALIGLSGQVSRLWPGLTTTQTIILIVTLEHIMLGLRSALTWLLPELPSWLAAEIARAEHCRREMQCKGTTPRPTPPTPPSTTSLSHQDAEQMTPMDAATTNDQSLESQLAEDILYQSPDQLHHGNLLQFEEIPFVGRLDRNIDADANIFENRDSSPDSPPSQLSTKTSTILIRPLHETTSPHSGISMLSLQQELAAAGASACKGCKQKVKIPEIPSFRGYSVRNLSSIQNQRMQAFSGPTSGSAGTLAMSSKPIQIPEIPPFRKKSNDSAECASSSSPSPRSTPLRYLQMTPPKIQEIPPFKIRKTSAESTQNLPITDKAAAMHQPHVPEWMSRLKVTEPINIHRSIDCIAVKPAPSWSNVASSKPIPIAGGTPVNTTTTTITPSALPIVTQSSRPSVSGTSSSSSSSHQTDKDKDKEKDKDKDHQNQQQMKNGKADGKGSNTTDDEAKAEELAAKKSRLKQKLVKSARSVAIFSLKLKERRQREAEKAANIAIEHAKALAKLPPISQPGGELSLIPIEKLIQVDDIRPTTRSPPKGNSAAGSF